MRHLSEKGRGILIDLEGWRDEVYDDQSGYPTIGVGHKLTQSEATSGKIRIGNQLIKYREGLTDKQISELLTQDLVSREECVWKNTTELEQHEFDSLVLMTFNIGCEAFAGSTLVHKLAHDLKDAVPSEMRKWKYSRGKVLNVLIARREVEIELWKGNA